MSKEFWRGRKIPADLLNPTDDTPVNGSTTAPISSNWAYDHAASATAHGISTFGATLVDDTTAAAARTTLDLTHAYYLAAISFGAMM